MDAAGRDVVLARDFVERHGIRTVFGMGGASVTGHIVVAIVCTTKTLDRETADRFPSLIGTFKARTAALVDQGRFFDHGAG